MIIKNGLIFNEEGVFEPGTIGILPNHTIASAEELAQLLENPSTEVFDAEGHYVIPGLVDVHIHGAVGHDFCDGNAQGLLEIATYLKGQGVTSFCPTSMTLPSDELARIFETITAVDATPNTARILGIHMEGPYIAPNKKGAQNGDFIQHIDTEGFARLQQACDNQIALVSIAPELPGAMDFIHNYHNDLTISIGHTEANYACAKEAFDLGACHVTHLFNAMLPLHHRDPGVIGAAADSPHAMVEIICDGIHLHPATIRSVFRLFGDDRTLLISDSMRAAGMVDGSYDLGGQLVNKCGNTATLSDGSLAGSVTNLFDCMRNAVSFGVPLASAVKAATMNPAKSIKKENYIGVIKPGNMADLVIMDSQLNIVQILSP